MEISLAKAPEGRYIVSKINGGHMLNQKLNSIGIYVGNEIEKTISYPKGPIIVKVFNTKIAIGRGMAEKIIVKKK